MISHSKRNYVLVSDYPGGNRKHGRGRGNGDSRSRSRSGNKSVSSLDSGFSKDQVVVDLTESNKPAAPKDNQAAPPQSSSSSSHKSKHHSGSNNNDNQSIGGQQPPQAPQKRQRVLFDITNMTYEQYCAKHYELEIESYRTQRNQFLQNSMNPNNVFPSQAPPQAYMMGPGHAGPGPMGGGGGGFMAAGPNPPLPPGPPPSKPLQ